MEKYTVAFVCVHNSCRSQMAEAWMKELGSDIFDAYSAGTEEYPEVKPLAVEVLKEQGIDMSLQYPKLLDKIPNKLDVLITMGCGVECPFIPCNKREDWGLIDPSGGPIEEFRKSSELIKIKVQALIEEYRNR